ncbi:hypothetical protein SERLA73DRAFT_186099 [Serpula lacrymans var. lacrymans S7.3]|uniref:DUF6699 domain-containing protein n=2 Tax=Serpula lacrymans var. lacrymans TaxID=341189 RepID=F8Q6Y4_SERL3|nr:uncharacterized protein SERLADRAFT_474963 [Serpula lacrymans var. lacrymans S7.9]EGN96372.1 hypothetical protein SERLA73DRAFT_186099 [Serpula lacrymans var. lacrymans S7.3]EGO21910.1 hypothetical protein SERLADRAFT_474963 [Serpula lacrymans var. lacrymans S7.9]
MVDQVGRWSAGPSYGPVLSQTDLYLLNTDLHLNPILENTNPSFHLIFNLASGQTGGFNSEARDHDLPFAAKDEPATLPRVSDLIIITELSPWCTVVHNDHGVTMGDVCTMIWKDYTDHYVTESEFGALPPRLQEQIKRAASHNGQGGQGWNAYYTPQVMPNRYRRVDWLRDKIFFECLLKKDTYAMARLGFKAPNIFVMSLTS